MIKTAHTTEIRIESIVVPPNRRPLDEARVQALMESFKLIGQRVPIIGWRPTPGNPPRLVAGRHRLEAAIRLGMDSIAVAMIHGDAKIDAQIAEVDENLCRRTLSAAEVAEAVQRRAELIEAKAKLEAEAAQKPVSVDTGFGRGGRGKKDRTPASTRDLADKTGRSQKSIHRAKRRAEVLGAEVIADVKLTSLDTPGELDALCELTPEEREPLVERAKAGEKVSARSSVGQRSVSRLQSAWDRATPAERATFVAELHRSGALDDLLLEGA